mgnify:FL=1
MFEGSVFKTKLYGDLIITKYINHKEVYVKFLDTGYETKAYFGNIKKGIVRDRSVPSILGVGIIGDEVTKVNGNRLKEYNLWQGLLERCYCDKFHVKCPTYKDCSVSDNFKYYPYFKEWCNNQIGFNVLDDKGNHFELDKDLLIKGNKAYSEDTCCFIPREINVALIYNQTKKGNHPIGVSYSKVNNKFVVYVNKGEGSREYLGYFEDASVAFLAYKASKEAYLKELANKWKDKIDPRVYEALIGWEINIDD